MFRGWLRGGSECGRVRWGFRDGYLIQLSEYPIQRFLYSCVVAGLCMRRFFETKEAVLVAHYDVGRVGGHCHEGAVYVVKLG